MYKRKFVHELRWAIAHAGLPDRHEAMLTKILVFANGEADGARPSQARLAKMMSKGSTRSIERMVADLKRAGWLIVTKKASSAGSANVYSIRFGRRFKSPDGKFEFLDELNWENATSELEVEPEAYEEADEHEF